MALNQNEVDDLFLCDAAPQIHIDHGVFVLADEIPKYPRRVTAVRLERPTPLVPKAKAGDWLCVSDTGAFGIMSHDELSEHYRRPREGESS